MSFNRLMYDKCETKKYLQESRGPGLYNYNPPLLCGNCFQDNPEIRMQKSGVSLNSGVDWRFYDGPVDVESDLLNINNAASRCPGMKYSPMTSNCGCENQGQPGGAGVIEGCFSNVEKLRKRGQRCQDNNLVDFPTCHFQTEDTRQSNPPSTLRGTGINRFEPLCMNPQDQVMFPGDYQVPTRLVVKDNHRPCVPTPNVNSMLPPQKPLPCQKITPVCGNNTSAMYQYDVCG